MPDRPFAHLHVHTQFSLLDGAVRLDDLVSRAEQMGMPAVAMTDHGNMFGALELYLKCKGRSVRPVLGCEVYLASGSRTEKTRNDTHLVLLARDLEGYRNLSYLVSIGWLEGQHLHPRIDLEVLAGRTKGLIGLSGCMGGAVVQPLLHQGPDEALTVASQLRDLFEPESFYLEVQEHGFPEQVQVNRHLADVGAKAGIPLVATNDVHFLAADDAASYQVLSCIAGGRVVPPDQTPTGAWTQMYLKSGDEMAAALRDYPEALDNTLAIAERCKVSFDLGKNFLPQYEVPEGRTLESYLEEKSKEGLDRRLAEIRAAGGAPDEGAYRARLSMELDVICRMGFAGYFLIVWDFIRYAREKGIPVGPGRGSGAGSIVAYSLRITNLDPIPYALLFERFLNPERVSMPDFDIDFCMNRRDEVIQYVTEKYGKLQVGQIATFHELKSRSCVRDVGRALGMAYTDVDKIAKLVPEPVQGKTTSVPEALEKEPRLKELYDKDAKIRELLDHAIKLEGLNRHAGMHAAGVVIADKPLWEYVPVFRGQNGELVSQYDKDLVEKVGLVKFDFLGLKTLTVIDIAVALIAKRPDTAAFDLERIALDDKATYKLLQSGETTGVFQLESSGMQDLFRKLRPDRFEDIVAAVALYRPGPLGTGMVDDYVQRKHGRIAVSYPHPLLETILEPTYGVIVYQEQVMQIASAMAGFSLGQADLLRRAMGKKKPEEMAKQKSVFVDGAKARGVDEAAAVKVFELLEFFAGYGFNKCVVGDTTIVDARTGERTTVGDLYRSRRPFTIHAMGEDGRLHARSVVDVVSNGRRRVCELRTAGGCRIRATSNHPFRTRDGWALLGDLRVGDRVAAARFLAEGREVSWDRVAALEPRGEEETFDLTVEEDHNFVADGLVVHNSHSAAYALVSYQTAFLKTHFPVEYMCALLTADKDKTEKVVRSIAEGRAMGITILPPDVNSSDVDFTVVYTAATEAAQPGRGAEKQAAIRFGLGAVKGVGGAALEALFEARKDGPFRDLFDFTSRVDPRKMNKAVVEALVWSGAFDATLREIGVSRAQAHAAIDLALERGRARARERESGQGNLFGLFDAAVAANAGATGALATASVYPQVPGWDSKALLAYERQALGFYITGHPLDRYRAELGRLATATTADLAEREEGAQVIVGGVVEAYRERLAKSGGRMAFFDLEDPSGRVEVIVRTRAFTEVETLLKSGEPLLVTGQVQVDRERDEPEAKLLLEQVQALAQAARARARTVHIHLDALRVSEKELRSLKGVLEQHPGKCPVSLHLRVASASDTILALGDELAVEPAESLLASLERLFGASVAELR